ncbi:MAG TPA: hypothetical protein DCZ05_08130 [Deltaproteobacteria bacterium]|nr:hypothetical protein [Deltaproteobacteria bacterium]
MKNLRNLAVLMFFVLWGIQICFAGSLEERADLPLAQTTPSDGVRVTFNKDKITYWSADWGISFSVPSNLRIWAREFRKEKNPLGEETPYAKSQERTAGLVLHVDNPYRKGYAWLMFNSKQLSDAETREWIEDTIGGWPDAKSYGMPERRNEINMAVNSVKVTRADYVWRRGARSLVASFRTSKGTYFFYARPESYQDLETVLKTLDLKQQ